MPSRNNKILLVEDEQNIARLFSFNLEKAGYECKVAVDGLVGLKAAAEYNPDLIISDIMMPNMDGFEFRKALLQDKDLGEIPFVFLTAKGDEDDILKGFDLEVEDYIIKTAGIKVVLAKISAIFNARKKERQKAVGEVHKAADSMKSKVVPENFPEFNGFKIKHWHVPFENVPGGDFIDYFKIDDNNIAVILGDVMGKKWGAWYFAVAYAGYVRSSVRFALESAQQLSAATILQNVNKSIFKDERISEVFITLSVILINNEMNTIQYSGAGDLPIIYKSEKETKPVKSNGLLLGFSDSEKYENVELKLNSRESIFIITDGITESRNEEKEALGEEGLYNILNSIKPDEDNIEVIKKEFDKFTGGGYEDDISLISIKAL